MAAILEIKAQAGPQEMFQATEADIAIYGGAAGGGKTYALLMDPLRHIDLSGFGAVIFRRTLKMVRDEGGLWDQSTELYPITKGRPNLSGSYWTFPTGSSIGFAGIEHEEDKIQYQGSQFAFIGFDELTQFTETQFFYLLSRNRTTCGIRPYVRGTTNPKANSWVKRLLAPWVDRKFPKPAESGELRWFIRNAQGSIEWVPAGTANAKSITFIRASLEDNKILNEKDPGYRSTLMLLPELERQQLLYGDWDAQPSEHIFDVFTTRMRFPVNPRWKRYAGHDFGDVHMAGVWAFQHPEETVDVMNAHGIIEARPVKIVYSTYLNGKRTDADHAESFLYGEGGPDQHPSLWRCGHENGDVTLPMAWGGNKTSEHGWRNSFTAEGYPIYEPPTDRVPDRIRITTKMLRTGEVQIFDDLTNLISDLEHYSYELDNEGVVNEEKVFQKSKWHRVDCIGTMCVGLSSGSHDIVVLKPKREEKEDEFRVDKYGRDVEDDAPPVYGSGGPQSSRVGPRAIPRGERRVLRTQR